MTAKEKREQRSRIEAQLVKAREACELLHSYRSGFSSMFLNKERTAQLAALVEQFTRLDQNEQQAISGGNQGGRPRQKKVSKNALYQREYRAKLKKSSPK